MGLTIYVGGGSIALGVLNNSLTDGVLFLVLLGGLHLCHLYTNMLETMGRKKVRKREALQHIPKKKEDLDLDP